MSQFKEQDFSRMFSVNAEGDRETRMQIGVYKGNAQMAIFKGVGAPVVSVKLGQDMQMTGIIARLLREAIRMSPGTSDRMDITRWIQEESKSVPEQSLTIGRDEKGIIHITVSAPNFEAKKFPIRLPFKVNIASKKDFADQSAMAAAVLSEDILLKAIPNAMVASNEKRDFKGGQGGGNRGGSGGGGYTGGGSGYPQQGQQQGAGAGGSSPSNGGGAGGASGDEIPY